MTDLDGQIAAACDNLPGRLAPGVEPIIAVACIRDEQDVVERFLRHNLAVVDGLIVLDHRSRDRTPAILAALVATTSLAACGRKTEAPAAPAAPAMPAIASVVATSNSTSSRSESPEPKVLIIGREISLTGQITACDKVVVEGKVEATLTDSRFVEIAETGQFKGSAEIEEAEVRGKFEGKLSVRGRLLIRGTGKVMGEIAYGQIEVECGGELSGTVQTVAAGNRLSSSVAAE